MCRGLLNRGTRANRVAFWKNPFEAPPPIPRAPLPSESAALVLQEAERAPEDDVDAVPEDRRQAHTRQRDLTLQFTGDTWEYFRLWTATQALIFLTLGLYAPWARVRRTRYLARHYRLDGVGFEYRANPWAILKGKLFVYALLIVGVALCIWSPLLIAPLVLISFLPLAWLLTHSFRFRWQTFRYRNIPFGFIPDAMSIFWPTVLMGVTTAYVTMASFGGVGAAGGSWGIFVGLMLSMLLALLAWPYVTSKLLHHRFSNALWGASRFRLHCTVGEIFNMLFASGKAFYFAIATIFTFLNVLSLMIKNIDLRSLAQATAYLLLTVAAVAYGRTRRLNYTLNRLQIGNEIAFVSTMEPRHAGWRAMRYGLASVFTLGLAIPWATIDFARWRTENLIVRLDGEWSSFPAFAPNAATKGAIVDGLAEQFGIEVGW